MSARHELSAPGSVPGWLVHAAVVVAAGIGAAATAEGAGWWPLIAVAVVAVGAFTRVIGVVVGGVGALLVAALLCDPAEWRTALLLASVHGAVVLGALASWIPLRTRLLPSALLPTAARFLWMQGLGQAVALGVGLLAPVEDAGAPAFAIIGALAVAVLAALVGWLWASALQDGQHRLPSAQD